MLNPRKTSQSALHSSWIRRLHPPLHDVEMEHGPDIGMARTTDSAHDCPHRASPKIVAPSLAEQKFPQETSEYKGNVSGGVNQNKGMTIRLFRNLQHADDALNLCDESNMQKNNNGSCHRLQYPESSTRISPKSLPVVESLLPSYSKDTVCVPSRPSDGTKYSTSMNTVCLRRVKEAASSVDAHWQKLDIALTQREDAPGSLYKPLLVENHVSDDQEDGKFPDLNKPMTSRAKYLSDWGYECAKDPANVQLEKATSILKGIESSYLGSNQDNTKIVSIGDPLQHDILESQNEVFPAEAKNRNISMADPVLHEVFESQNEISSAEAKNRNMVELTKHEKLGSFGSSNFKVSGTPLNKQSPLSAIGTGKSKYTENSQIGTCLRKCSLWQDPDMLGENKSYNVERFADGNFSPVHSNQIILKELKQNSVLGLEFPLTEDFKDRSGQVKGEDFGYICCSEPSKQENVMQFTRPTLPAKRSVVLQRWPNASKKQEKASKKIKLTLEDEDVYMNSPRKLDDHYNSLSPDQAWEPTPKWINSKSNKQILEKHALAKVKRNTANVTAGPSDKDGSTVAVAVQEPKMWLQRWCTTAASERGTSERFTSVHEHLSPLPTQELSMKGQFGVSSPLKQERPDNRAKDGFGFFQQAIIQQFQSCEMYPTGKGPLIPNAAAMAIIGSTARRVHAAEPLKKGMFGVWTSPINIVGESSQVGQSKDLKLTGMCRKEFPGSISENQVGSHKMAEGQS